MPSRLVEFTNTVEKHTVTVFSVVLSSKMLVNFHWTILLHTPKDGNLFSHLHEHLNCSVD